MKVLGRPKKAYQISDDVSEREFLATIIDIAHMTGWLVSHQRPAWTEKGYRTAIQGDAGFVDLVLLRDRHLIFAELKSSKGKLTADQVHWNVMLCDLSIWACRTERDETYFPVRYYTWRPQDIEKIKAVLR